MAGGTALVAISGAARHSCAFTGHLWWYLGMVLLGLPAEAFGVVSFTSFHRNESCGKSHSSWKSGELD